MDPMQEKAREVGRLIAQTPEYRALKQANDRLGDDRETVTLLNRLNALQDELAGLLRGGQEPDEAQTDEYERLMEQVQQRAAYQGMVAAQANFDRLMLRVNEEIARGIEAGEQSRIIFP